MVDFFLGGLQPEGNDIYFGTFGKGSSFQTLIFCVYSFRNLPEIEFLEQYCSFRKCYPNSIWDKLA